MRVMIREAGVVYRYEVLHTLMNKPWAVARLHGTPKTQKRKPGKKR